MHDRRIKLKVIQKRTKGVSINDISRIYSLNKSTVSYWCRDIELSELAIKKIKTKGKRSSVQGLLRYSEVRRKERIKKTIFYKEAGATHLGKLSERDCIMVGLGLYWGEGYKESNGEMGFTNSNPAMILFYIYWLSLWKVEKKDLIFRLTINNIFEKDKKSLELFWVNLLGVEHSQFSKTTVIKTKLKKAFGGHLNTYKGILRVKVRNGLKLKNMILGGIDHISNQLK